MVGTGPTSALVDLPLGDLLRLRATESGRRTFLRSARTGEQLSYGQIQERADGWGDRLRAAGVAPGDVVAISVAEPLTFATAFLGAISAGVWVAPIDPKSPESTLTAAIERFHPGALISDRSGTIEVHELDRNATGESATGVSPNAPSPTGSEPFATGPGGGSLLSSSGTTGAPKVLPLSIGRLLLGARTVAAHHRLSADDVCFNPLPLHHVNAEVVALLGSLVGGGCVVLDDRFHRTGCWRLLEDVAATWVNAVPAIVARLVPLRPDEHVAPTIRFVRSASAPLPVATLQRFERFTGLAVLETYGMTEAAGQITANPLDGIRKPGSVGVPVGTEVRIVPFGAAHAGAPNRSVGQVEIRGGAIASGVGDGWLATGDLGELDEDGYLFLRGRTDDVINRGGEKIYPREIEELLAADPAIDVAIVVGIDDGDLGRIPRAFVTLLPAADGSFPDAEAVARSARDRLCRELPPARRPDAVVVTSDLERTVTGKVRRTTGARSDAVTLATASTS